MTRRLARWALFVAAAVALSGCYTVLWAPHLSSAGDESQRDSAWQDEPEPSPRLGRFADDRDAADPYAYGRGGYPIYGYDSQGGLYGFGTPFAYGPGLGSYYPYGAYSPSYGPYGYGYDPYYSGNGTYVPPGYELVTARELADLKAENAALQASLDGAAVVPTLNQDEVKRQQQQAAQRAWEQRAEPERKSTAEVRTTRPAPASATTAVTTGSTSSTKPASSSSSSGSSAAKTRKTRR